MQCCIQRAEGPGVITVAGGGAHSDTADTAEVRPSIHVVSSHRDGCTRVCMADGRGRRYQVNFEDCKSSVCAAVQPREVQSYFFQICPKVKKTCFW